MMKHKTLHRKHNEAEELPVPFFKRPITEGTTRVHQGFVKERKRSLYFKPYGNSVLGQRSHKNYKLIEYLQLSIQARSIAAPRAATFKSHTLEMQFQEYAKESSAQ